MKKRDYDDEISLIFWVVILCLVAYAMHTFYKTDEEMQSEYENSFDHAPMNRIGQ